MTAVAAAAPARAAPGRHSFTRAATIGDQVLVSLTNFALTLAIGRAFTATELAAYGIGLSVGLMMQGLQRHATLIPLMLRTGTLAPVRRGAVIAEQVLIVLAALLVAGVAWLVLSCVAASRYAVLAVEAGLVCLLVYVQLEFARAFLTKLGKPLWLLAGAGWYAAATALAAGLALAGMLPFEGLLAALGGAMLLHLLALAAAAGRFDFRRGARLLGSDLRRYGGWSATATATYAGYNHLPLMVLAALAAPVHAAAFVAARSLLQPLQILLRGLDVADKSAFAAKAGAAHARQALGFTLRLAVVYAAVAVGFGLVVALVGDRLAVVAYGAKFSHIGPALVAWAPVYVLIAASMPLESLVYRRRSFGAYFVWRGVASLVAAAASVPLIRLYAETGAIAACGLGWLVAVIATYANLRRSTPS